MSLSATETSSPLSLIEINCWLPDPELSWFRSLKKTLSPRHLRQDKLSVFIPGKQLRASLPFDVLLLINCNNYSSVALVWLIKSSFLMLRARVLFVRKEGSAPTRVGRLIFTTLIANFSFGCGGLSQVR
jgi:hypothetical protein